MKKIKMPLLVLCLLYFLPIGHSQENPESSDRWYVLTKDKNKYIGRIIEEDRSNILLETETVGTIRIRTKEVRYMETFYPESMVNKVYYPKYKFPHHNTFTPTGEIGESYYQNILIYGNTLNWSFDDKWSLGGGMIPITEVEVEGFYFWISPKVLIKTKHKNIDFSLGYFAAIRPSNGYVEPEGDLKAGVFYGAASHGNEFFKVGAGLGYGMLGGDFLNWPFYTMDMMYRIQNRSFFRFEIFGGGQFGSFTDVSFRQQRKKATWDLGWIIPANRGRDISYFFGGPYLSALYTLTK